MTINIMQLPQEMKSTIFSFLEPSLLNSIKYHIVCGNLRENFERIHLFAILRIQLAYRLMRESKNKTKRFSFS